MTKISDWEINAVWAEWADIPGSPNKSDAEQFLLMLRERGFDVVKADAVETGLAAAPIDWRLQLRQIAMQMALGSVADSGIDHVIAVARKIEAYLTEERKPDVDPT